jgi:hypothetical protein
VKKIILTNQPSIVGHQESAAQPSRMAVEAADANGDGDGRVHGIAATPEDIPTINWKIAF